ncbi:MAG: ATP-binding protein [Elusimicrobiota bacterium]|jgi:signal transduction histidine kinase
MGIVILLLPELNLYNLPVLLAAILNAGLVLFVVSMHGTGQPIRRAFVVWNLAICIWNLGSFGGYGASSELAAVWWTRLCGFGIVWIPALFLHLVLLLKGPRTKLQGYLLHGLYLMGSLLLLFSLTSKNFLVVGAIHRFWGWAPVGGLGSTLLDSVMAVSSVYSLVLLRSAVRQSFDVQRNQLLYVFWGALIGYVGGGLNVLAIHGVEIYPYGNFFNILYSLAVAYAIVSYQWMDIRLALRQSVVYGSLGTALTLTYIAMVFIIDKLLAASSSSNPWGAWLLAMPPTVLATPTLKNKIQPWVEQHLFSEWQWLKQKLEDLGILVCTCLDLQKIGEAVIRCSLEDLQVEHASLWLWDPAHERLNCVATQGLTSAMSGDSFRPEWLEQTGHRPLFTRDLEWRLNINPVENTNLFPLRDWLLAHQAATLVPVHFQNHFLGVWLLGARHARDMWPREITQKFQAVANQLALAMNMSMMVQKFEKQRGLLEKTREMAAMGILATELAHELAQPLTRILNAEAGLQQTLKGESSEGLARIEKETLRASEILESFTMLSPQMSLQRTAIPVADLIDEAIDLLGIQDDPAIHLVKEIDHSATAFIHRGQIVQVLTNLIQNARQAMPDGGTLTISLQSLTNLVEISIMDTGAGIPPEARDRVFDAFFTTKQQVGRRGVGLTLSRAMVERHGGTIRLESPITATGGTRALVHLPIMPMEERHET